MISCLYAIAAMFAPPARGDDLCPLGWFCTAIANYKSAEQETDAGTSKIICNINQIARFKTPTDSQTIVLHMVTRFHRKESTADVAFQIFPQLHDNGQNRSLAPKAVRVMSADRILDTKLWAQEIGYDGNASVLGFDAPLNGAVLRTILKVATGSLHAVLVHTAAGQYLRLEVSGQSKSADDREAIRRFRECIERRPIRLPEAADRG